ncbi:T9SS type A sorting domain-containing protein [Flavobacterium sp. NST-5]|uniref:T9SS type A sorting domain-containing protein n=1 Tax=Flavobacterium ichthyis TaxID=2698827 RepID=A0ABW9ZD55_9FLAO|nr:T9SS type A sorting domain-containing protein [Flavobacterium ichthyis]NBL65689.1 T9SS type A sorting domain-containing protein [Flavobacterium ichthyis]
MKKFLLLFTLFSFKSFSQDPNLVRTWYLTHKFENGQYEPAPALSEIGRETMLTIESLNSPTIATNICNDNYIQGVVFSGSTLTYTGVISTLTSCNDHDNNLFDLWYSSFFGSNISTGLNYSIIYLGDSPSLYLTSPSSGSQAIYRPQAMSTEEFNKTAFSLAPNPAENFISIKANENLKDVQVTIYNKLGQIIATQKHASVPENIDVSILNSGMYYLEIVFSNGKETKKFIKK